MLKRNSLLLDDFFESLQSKDDWSVYRLPDEEEPFHYEFFSGDRYRALYDFVVQKDLDEKEIRRRCDEVNWKYVCRWVELSESFIREFRNYVDWNLIKKYQKVSDDFLIEMGKKKRKKK